MRIGSKFAVDRAGVYKIEGKKKVKIANYMKLKELIRDINTGECKSILEFEVFKELKEIEVTRGQYLNKNDLIKLNNQGLDVTHLNVSELVEYFRESENEFKGSKKVHTKLGFENDKIYRLYNSIGDNSTYVGGYELKPLGNREEYLKMLSTEVHGKCELEFALLGALSVVILGYIGEDLGLDSLIVNLVGNSSSGKPSRIYDGEYPLTGILKCPVCGAGMVIARTTNMLKDGTKKRIAYYACGWKNKGTAVCHSNSIRVDSANDYVFKRIEELLTNGKMVKDIIKNLNTVRKNVVEPKQKKLDSIEKELTKLKSKKTKILEDYEDELITKEELVERKSMLDEKINSIETLKSELINFTTNEEQSEISYAVVKEILQGFGRIMLRCTSREKQKTLLHMLISKITISKDRTIDSINLKINDNLIEYLSSEEAPIRGASSFLMQKFKFGRMKLNIAI